METDMAGLRLAKQELRKFIRQRLCQLGANAVKKQSALATKALFSIPEYKNATNIGVYLSMPSGELQTRLIVNDALLQGKKVFVPYIHKSICQDPSKPRSVMDMVSLHSQGDFESLKPDAWGIPSVDAGSLDTRQKVLSENNADVDGIHHDESGSNSNHDESTKVNRLDMIVMPGVAFDSRLSRLGHGKGFYDYFLERYHSSQKDPMPLLAGLALDVQLLPDDQEVPSDASDYKVDTLVVGDGTILRR